jgi:hypothetical protein
MELGVTNHNHGGRTSNGPFLFMKVIGWIEIYSDDSMVGECSPYYDLLEWIETHEF